MYGIKFAFKSERGKESTGTFFQRFNMDYFC